MAQSDPRAESARPATRNLEHGLLERVDELARIDAALADLASGGRGHVIAIQGDAGSGRSALLGAARALAAQRSLPVVAAADARDAGGPVVVAVDDVDRADAVTQGRVAEAAGLAAELPIALIVTTPVAGLDDGTR